MKDLKRELFDFSKKLDDNQDEILTSVIGYTKMLENYSELQVFEAMKKGLDHLTYDKDVRGLMESIQTDIDNNKIMYQLKHLYLTIDENKNFSSEGVKKLLLEIINTNENNRINMILNELPIYDYISEVKSFISSLIKTPTQKINVFSKSDCQNVYGICETLNKDSHLIFIENSWFHYTPNNIEKTLLENHITNVQRLNTLRILENAIKFGYVETKSDKNVITFRLNENTSISIETEFGGSIFINDEIVESSNTIENLYETSLSLSINKNIYPILRETTNNIDKFIEIDFAKKITNSLKEGVVKYIFNTGEKGGFVYTCDNRQGNSLVEYETSNELLSEVKREYNYDLTDFLENKLSKETVKLKKIEDTIVSIYKLVEDLNIHIERLESHSLLVGKKFFEAEAVKSAYDKIVEMKKEYQDVLSILEKQKISLLTK